MAGSKKAPLKKRRTFTAHFGADRITFEGDWDALDANGNFIIDPISSRIAAAKLGERSMTRNALARAAGLTD